MHALTKGDATKTLVGSDKAADLPPEIEAFFDRCTKVNYGMTSNPNFDRRSVGLIVALAKEFTDLEKRVAALELKLEEANEALERVTHAPARQPAKRKPLAKRQTAGV